MKPLKLSGIVILYIAFFGSFFSCKKNEKPALPTLVVSGNLDNFGTVIVGNQSASKFVQVSGSNLKEAVTVQADANFKISKDNVSFTNTLTIDAAQANTGSKIYVQYAPTASGNHTGNIYFKSTGVTTVSLPVSGNCSATHTYTTFANQQLAFGGSNSQSAVRTFALQQDMSKVEKIKMYIKLRCPSGGCDAWDVFGHIQVKDPASGDWYELGRYMTPYGKGNEQVSKGFEIDVTDFKSLLQGNVELRAFIEVWGGSGWLLSVDFDYVEGTPDYQYYAISKLIQYNRHSLDGVIYGEDASAFVLTKKITPPANTQATYLRTIISGWGHATPNDPGNRGCAEWCFRTHYIKINGANTFAHELGAIGCATNPVQPQNGTWQYERAGWCPGMAVPVRTNKMATSMAGQKFNFEYSFAPWVNDLQSTASNVHAYYAISTYVIVKSNTPIAKPVVED